MRLHTNLFDRDVTSLRRPGGDVVVTCLSFSWIVSGRDPLQVDIYVAGFPCKAFSKLREKTDGLQDKEAQPFYEVTSVMKEIRPKAGVCSFLFHEQHIPTDGFG